MEKNWRIKELIFTNAWWDFVEQTIAFTKKVLKQAPKFGGNNCLLHRYCKLEMAGTIFHYCQYFYLKKQSNEIVSLKKNNKMT